ncbi:nitroreductase [Ktedonosporobacter rubrisoli]|uniref:Putative NAD(P)H nitroreductase n=2 Tax=Ktedonosporobacter rubrisoli TaxID=2509675 RepID=A0A4P6K587_KTERU|nr:nitroreductase [Ktedonosporobacter rubrisoli]
MADGEQTTSVFATIKRRRSIGKMTEEVPTREQIERMLEAAVYAPNHHTTEPWRFFVLLGQARHELGKIMQQALAEQLLETTSEKAQARLNKARNKPLRAPVIIIVVSVRAERAGVQDIEDLEATAAAVQNMLLVAEELGLACIWRTGDAAYAPQVKRWLGIAEEDHIVALLDVGFPAIKREEHPVRSIKEKTIWLD